MRRDPCAVCGEQFFEGDGNVVYFRPRLRTRIAAYVRSRGPAWGGHPPNAVWVCDEHIDAARELSHLTKSAALKRLEEEYGPPDRSPEGDDDSSP